MLSRDRLDAVLDRIADPAGEGGRICLTVYPAAARAAADAADARARAGVTLGPLDGAIVTIKDLFDVRGEPTRAGSRLLADAPPAPQDAAIVTRLRQAGAVIVAKTNMSEFAFHGIGTNPHYGAPGNPADRARAPGGSSSGAAVAVADGVGEIAIGTDTGGSTRVPAAFCGVVGWKPTKARVPTTGAFPLSQTLDSIGPLARSVEACARADGVMAGDEPWTLEPQPLAGLRIGVFGEPFFDGVDAIVGPAVERAIAQLSAAGATVTDVDVAPLLARMAAVNARGGFASAEAFAVHRGWIDDPAADVDVNVRLRIERGRGISAADYMDFVTERAVSIAAFDAAIARYDAFVAPTAPIVAPLVADLGTPGRFSPVNMLALRNTSPVNFFDLCAISLPIPAAELPVGLMLVGRRGSDRRLFEIAAGVEALLRR